MYKYPSPTKITFISKYIGSGFNVDVTKYPYCLFNDSIDIFPVFKVLFKQSHENALVNKSLTFIIKYPPLALCNEPGFISIKLVVIAPTSLLYSILPVRL